MEMFEVDLPRYSEHLSALQNSRIGQTLSGTPTIEIHAEISPHFLALQSLTARSNAR